MSSGDGTDLDRDDGPSPIDVHVGSRIRLRRTFIELSQQRLAEALGLTIQQIQKYERGSKRVAAQRLFDLSGVLDVPVSFFFDEVPRSLETAYSGRSRAKSAANFAAPRSAFGEEQMNREALELVRAFCRIVDPMVRKRVLDLVRSLSSSNESS